MASLREIAELAKVSIGTTSFVLNGKGDQMRISKATQQKVLEAAKTLGYRPNIMARRLRNEGGKNTPVIAILWTVDTRASLLGRFLKGIQDKFVNQDSKFELLIQPYENSKLHKLDSLLTANSFNGAIIANASERDQFYLENTDIKVPLVLYQRDSEKYSTVNVDSFKTGERIANLFENRGHKKVGMIIPNVSSQAIHLRKEGFINGTRNTLLDLSSNHIIFGDFSEKGGYHAAKELLMKQDLPSAIFFLSDHMAAGALAAFHEAGICIPRDIEVIGHDNYELTQFTVPSLSTVHLPVEDMASSCVNTLLYLIENKVDKPVSVSFDTRFVFRNSCGDFSKADLIG